MTIELYLVRHAIAAERGPKYPDDRLRPLTPAGTKKFAQAVPGLVELDVAIDFVLTSPLVRARETATLLASALKPKPAIAEIEALAPGGRHQAVIEAIKTHSKRHRRLALVGHEPDLGELAARLIGARGNIEFKKGAVCLIEVDGATPGGPGTLRWMLPPRAMKALAG
ncbi:MAG TPA: phosphohistidine phosphatase SixA [Vicinamibacterales bacterium]|nr:phosphohistidine phosphatase SixA [Vicinamibacterales bacterium]